MNSQPRFAALFLLAAVWSSAQVDTATITGNVTDPSGAAIAGANIRAINTANGLDYRASSGDAGVYVITALPVGTYDLEASGQGFQTIRRRAITLNAGTRAKVDVQLHSARYRKCWR
ncbi:MAG: carboxypeptidase regulatory-like domain-containing protein [Bryobacterales bacterium]|nr:carboxypeptidase regulatory-like domain-containing protein [Bryobacterales bacterium]